MEQTITKVPFVKLLACHLLIVLSAHHLIPSSIDAQELKEPPPLKVIYFVPSDCDPLPNREERLGRVMRHIQKFYREGMESHGYGSKTFALEWEAPDKLRLHTVQGKKKLREYGNDSGRGVAQEVREALHHRGIDIDKEFVLVLGTFFAWENGVATGHGPYNGGGNSFSGYAVAYEDERLDSALLTSAEPGGYYHGPCSLGVFNTKFIGGIAHELGHCFGLPHECQLSSESRTLGVSIMGLGNQTYGGELRNEGPGAFLSASAALRLSANRAFVADLPESSRPTRWQFEKLDAAFQEDKLILTGQGETAPLPLGIVAYNDKLDVLTDYDATSWVAPVDRRGVFRFEISELKRVPYELRLVAIMPSGDTVHLTLRYDNTNGTPDREIFVTAVDRSRLAELFRNNDLENAETLLRKMIKKHPESKEWKRKAKHVSSLVKPSSLLDLKTIPPAKRTVDLTAVETQNASVGWGEPSRGMIKGSGFFQIDNAFFESGFYAHAPSLYGFSLGKRWKTFQFAYGIQDENPGSVVFVVRGDGKELFRSGIVKDHKLRRAKCDVSEVERLELVTEDAGDNGYSDWGLWIEPVLKR